MLCTSVCQAASRPTSQPAAPPPGRLFIRSQRCPARVHPTNGGVCVEGVQMSNHQIKAHKPDAHSSIARLTDIPATSVYTEPHTDTKAQKGTHRAPPREWPVRKTVQGASAERSEVSTSTMARSLVATESYAAKKPECTMMSLPAFVQVIGGGRTRPQHTHRVHAGIWWCGCQGPKGWNEWG